MEIEIVSRENIKPSSPTPHHLKIYKLSLLDYSLPPLPVPLVLYFPNTVADDIPIFNNVSERTKVLKQSLSATLTRFYPLAGRIMKDGLRIDCNDEGVVFVVAKLKGQLSDFLKNPDTQASARLHIPNDLSDSDGDLKSNVPMMTQISYFDCGGMAIGSVFLHNVVDGFTLATVLKSWAAAARRCEEQEVTPNYIAQSNCEATESKSQLFFSEGFKFKTGKTVMRRFVFDASAISTLKAKLIDEEEEEEEDRLSTTRANHRLPTRVEAVSAFLWKCFMAACLANKKPISLIDHVVNLRRRAYSPAQMEHCFGNLTWLARASSNNQIDMGTKQLVGKMRDAISKIDGRFVKGFMLILRGECDDDKELEEEEEEKGGFYFSGYTKNIVKQTCDPYSEGDQHAYLCISSWCNFGLYSGADFGWGKPIWLNRCQASKDLESPFMNLVCLIDTNQGDGIEAWITLEDKFMEVFDTIDDLQILASVNPSPLDIGRRSYF